MRDMRFFCLSKPFGGGKEAAAGYPLGLVSAQMRAPQASLIPPPRKTPKATAARMSALVCLATPPSSSSPTVIDLKDYRTKLACLGKGLVPRGPERGLGLSVEHRRWIVDMSELGLSVIWEQWCWWEFWSIERSKAGFQGRQTQGLICPAP